MGFFFFFWLLCVSVEFHRRHSFYGRGDVGECPLLNLQVVSGTIYGERWWRISIVLSSFSLVSRRSSFFLSFFLTFVVLLKFFVGSLLSAGLDARLGIH